MVQVLLSTRPDKSVGSDAIWDQAEGALREALETKGWPFQINEADGAFYGVCALTAVHFQIEQRYELSCSFCPLADLHW